MSLIANEITTSDIYAPDVVIKVISRNSRKNITKISGLIPYFSEEIQKRYLANLEGYVQQELLLLMMVKEPKR